jgi:hypothetical protein
MHSLTCAVRNDPVQAGCGAGAEGSTYTSLAPPNRCLRCSCSHHRQRIGRRIAGALHPTDSTLLPDTVGSVGHHPFGRTETTARIGLYSEDLQRG